ncbi:MAG TPA: FHA domain-containing protein [Ktedonobacteraceae bacterium]
MGGVDFPTWFSAGYYGGMACCIFAIAGNALYTTLRKRGNTRQLTTTVVICVFSALLLLPAIFWFNLRFYPHSATISSTETALALLYIAIWGWLLPLGISGSYCLYSVPRIATTAAHIPEQKKTTRKNPTTDLRPPRYQPGAVIPVVFDEYTPWGWLEYRSGSFQGQRLELKRSIITMGRDERCDIWVDDEMASRLHAELAWYQGSIFLTDCDSMNGIIVNGRRINDYSIIEPNDLIEIGTFRFTFVLAEQKQGIDEANDPLALHTWRSVQELQGDSVKGFSLPRTSIPGQQSTSQKPTLPGGPQNAISPQQTDKWNYQPINSLRLNGLLVVKEGTMAGQTFLLDRQFLTAGRGLECDIIINDLSVAKQHIQLMRQTEGDYIHDLTSQHGTNVNGAVLQGPRLLKNGDRIQIGNIMLEYASLQSMQYTPLPPLMTPPPIAITRVGPTPLRLPSRPVVPKHVE